jgi:hypothetical protein
MTAAGRVVVGATGPPPPAVVGGAWVVGAWVVGAAVDVVVGRVVVVDEVDGAREVVVLSTVGPVSMAVGSLLPRVNTTTRPSRMATAAAMHAGISHLGRPPSSSSLVRLVTGS